MFTLNKIIKILIFPILTYVVLFEIRIGNFLVNNNLIYNLNLKILKLTYPNRKKNGVLLDFSAFGLNISEISLLMIFILIIAYVFFKDRFIKIGILASLLALFGFFIYGLVITFFY